MVNADGLATRLVDEHDRKERFRPFAAANGIVSLDGAYEIQDRYVSLLKPRCGAPIGYKIGLTSQRMQTMCGIDQPIAGVVLADRLHRSGARVGIADYGRIGLEFEIAVRIGLFSYLAIRSSDEGSGATTASRAGRVTNSRAKPSLWKPLRP